MKDLRGRFMSERTTEYLQNDLILAGPLVAHLSVSTTGTDADWIVKLIDVYPIDAPDNITTRTGKQDPESYLS